MKILATILFFAWASVAFAQTEMANKIGNKKNSAIRMSFTTYNHAERIYDGVSTYILTNSSVIVKKRFLFGKKSKTIYRRRIKNEQTLVSSISNIKLDSLEDHYFNNCILITSGDEYSLSVEIGSTKKTLRLHHYYLKQLEDIIRIINSNLPAKYQIRYLSSTTKQDCEL